MAKFDRGLRTSALYQIRHVRRLLPILTSLLILTLVWSPLVVGASIVVGGISFIWDRNFVQNVVASLLVLPIGLTVGVVVGAFLQSHSLRFQGRQWGDRLCQRITTTIFGFMVYLNRDCKLPIDLSGPTGSRFVERGREAMQNALAAASWDIPMPSDFEVRLYKTVAEMEALFTNASELRFAFPRAFEQAEDIQSSISDIRLGRSSSRPAQTALMLLNAAARIIHDLE